MVILPRFIDMCIETPFTVNNCLINKDILSHIYGKSFPSVLLSFTLNCFCKTFSSFTSASSTSTVWTVFIFSFSVLRISQLESDVCLKRDSKSRPAEWTFYINYLWSFFFFLATEKQAKSLEKWGTTWPWQPSLHPNIRTYRDRQTLLPKKKAPLPLPPTPPTQKKIHFA